MSCKVGCAAVVNPAAAPPHTLKHCLLLHMSKSSKQRRSDDEFKPPSAKKSKHHVKQETPEHTSVQRIRLLDLIKYNYLNAGYARKGV